MSDQLLNHLDSDDPFNIDEFWEGVKPHVISALTDQCRWGDELIIVESNGGNN